ncbi:MAG: alpha/beta fold hydrolase [Lysobacteraceae bacterium]|nr:MAG: alpha/beta fold hydrolase [Xanthomonadaceae bacterium]
MTISASPYQPPFWLRSPHIQSLLATSPLRRARGALLLRRCGAVSKPYIVDGGEGVRLEGVHSRMPGIEPRGLALLLHGWEGSVESSYMRMTAVHLLGAGFEVFRLNFRDHGDTHHLNPALFHSNRIDEVVHAAQDVANRFLSGAARPMVVAGYSLGGNFALRVALRARKAGLPLARAAAICPLLDPAETMTRMEQGLPFYIRYFERKWRESLRRKRDSFPDYYDFDDRVLRLRMRELTRWMVERHTDFDTLDDYFNGYSVAGDRLAGLEVPVDLLTSEDDPVIPVAEFHALRLPENGRIEIAGWGGHCGFLESALLDGYAERWVTERLSAALESHA